MEIQYIVISLLVLLSVGFLVCLFIKKDSFVNDIYYEYTTYNLLYYFDNLNNIKLMDNPNVLRGPACKL